MASHPLVSIVTPVLNRASMIRSCLASVSAQTHPRVEHIVVDGGSDDGTMQIIRTFESSHSLRWVSEPDGGMYDAINKGLQLASGSILAYLNSDDMYLPWSVEVAVAGLRDGADLTFGDMGLLRRGQKRGRRTFQPKFYAPFDLNYYTHFATIGQPTVFWSADVTRRIGVFDTSYQLVADCEYWLRAAVAGCVLVHVDEILAIQVEHSGTLRNTKPDVVEAELRRLRTSYTRLVGPPARPSLVFIRQGARWRLQQLRFGFSSAVTTPTKWPRFLGFLKHEGIRVDRRALLWYMVPSRFRPGYLSSVDGEFLERRLGDGRTTWGTT